MKSCTLDHIRSEIAGTVRRQAPVFLAGLLPLLGFCTSTSAAESNSTDLVRLQMINDMMYAADDFFGECRHLFYADQSRLPPAPAPIAIVKVTVVTTTPSYSDSKSTIPIQGGGTTITTTTVAGTGGTGGSGSTGGSTGGGGLPPDGGGGGGDPGGGGCST